MLEQGTCAIKFGNKGFLEVAGVGTVELQCETPEGEQVNLLREVAYVPGVAENLFSVKKATAVGAEVVFRGKVCEVSMDGQVVLRAKRMRTACPLFVNRRQQPLEVMHMDVSEPMRVTSKGGSRYLATFLDDYCKLLVVQPMKRKSDATAVTESAFARLELQSGMKVKGMQTDRGGEYVNGGMTALLGKRGTVHRNTAGHSPEQNGSAERLNRTLEERARAFLEDARLEPELWAEAMVTANYTWSRVPSSVHDKTPWEKSSTGRSQILAICGWATPTGKADTESEDSVEEDGLQEETARRYPARERQALGEWYRANLAETGKHPKRSGEHPEPQTYQEAVGGEERALGEVHGRGDAVLVGERDGYLQKQGIDFEEVYSPVSKHTTLRALLAVVAERYLELHELDVKTAILNGELEEKIYMQQPQGYEQGGPNVICHLKRTLYGLRQALRAWHTRLKEELGNFEFVAFWADAALFSGVVDGERVYLIVWVDDILVAARGAERILKVKVHLTEKFDVHDLGEAIYFLGMELARDRKARTLKLTQKKLTGKLLGRHGLVGARARSVPLGAGEKLTREGEPLDTARFPYSELIGSLLYLSVCTRPDIAQAVGALARCTSAPTEAHWAAALRVVRYLAGTAEAE
ncbi:Reverse transcriptase [Klebsormidium nitens]|uniref:Reverse transcriptase n=1 Tax=Klebsormidium nitens TaxID=105231 RepID=A0A1Y1INK8_KLENI|nr:Reverse transcriptase [Klebsormidium nitens]|eukprot:GAQ92324.1 Reverse transcriptase [Klebsormidium nitens]